MMGLLALPAIWSGRDGKTVLLLMAQAIECIVPLRMSFVDVPLMPDEQPFAMLRLSDRPATPVESSEWHGVLAKWKLMPIGTVRVSLDTPIGQLQVIRLGMGYCERQGSVWFGAQSLDFPALTQLAFLRAATSLAATGLQGARATYEREQASLAKDEFLAMLGHELRNPLAPISTALELIKRRSKEPLDKHHAIIERQVNHLSRLVDDLLDVSRMARGKIELRLEPLHIGAVIARAVEAVSPLIEQRQHQLDLDLRDDDRQIVGDMTRLTQVFVNLLTNSAKYTQPGGSLRIATTLRESWACITVTDNGAGIAPELMPRLFSIFEQGRTTIARSGGGLGIGLALVKSLVERHGGTVTVTTGGVGMGSEFTVLLPLAAPVPASLVRAAATATASAAVASRPGTRVLLVDDNIDALESMEAYLSDLGFDVVIAADPDQAMILAATFFPQVAVLDIGLPGMDGYQLGEALRARQPALALRLLALSGYGQPGDRARSAAAGFERHFVKPIDLPALVAALDAVTDC